jgi:small subunit ribosomal protein S20
MKPAATIMAASARLDVSNSRRETGLSSAVTQRSLPEARSRPALWKAFAAARSGHLQASSVTIQTPPSQFFQETVLAHSKSALKRWRQSIERRNRNRSMKSRTRTLLTKALGAISDDANAAEAAVREAISGLDRAAQKGVIHANAAARSKARLLKRFHLGQASAVAAAASGQAPEGTRRATRSTATPRTPRPRTRKT